MSSALSAASCVDLRCSVVSYVSAASGAGAAHPETIAAEPPSPPQPCPLCDRSPCGCLHGEIQEPHFLPESLRATATAKLKRRRTDRTDRPDGVPSPRRPLRIFGAKQLGPPAPPLLPPHAAELLLASRLAAFASRLSQAKRVIVMVGAGVSVASGIPDFRTPGTGLYDNLQAYELPFPEAVFDIDFFQQNPAPFYRLCSELWPGRFAPTTAHLFIKLLHDKGKLCRVYSQNIDSLERAAGLPADMIVAAHGNFDSAHVVGTRRLVPIGELEEALAHGEAGWRALEAKHGGLVKPSITFFGEALPERFRLLVSEDFESCDLLIVMGTSLQVRPFNLLIGFVDADTARLLINRERVGEVHEGFVEGGFDFDAPEFRDVFFCGDCDAGVVELASLLGWQSTLDALVSASKQGRCGRSQ